MLLRASFVAAAAEANRLRRASGSVSCAPEGWDDVDANGVATTVEVRTRGTDAVEFAMGGAPGAADLLLLLMLSSSEFEGSAFGTPGGERSLRPGALEANLAAVAWKAASFADSATLASALVKVAARRKDVPEAVHAGGTPIDACCAGAVGSLGALGAAREGLGAPTASLRGLMPVALRSIERSVGTGAPGRLMPVAAR